MTRYLVGAILALSANVAQAEAQMLAKTIPAGGHAMPSRVVDRPMSDLLADGYDIVSFSAGLGGYGYLLRRERVWVICAMGLYGDPASPRSYSRCEQLSK